MIGVPLGKQGDAAQLKIRIPRVAYRFGANFVMQRTIEPPRVADHRRRIVSK
jgi:hypothetical protein